MDGGVVNWIYLFWLSTFRLMVPSLLFDIADIDLDQIQYGVGAIEEINPHRGCMRMLDGINHVNTEFTRAVGFKDVCLDEFWVEGHIPGRPLFPGVLMVEVAAQLTSFITMKHLICHGKNPFLGLVGIDDVRFRGQVEPGHRLIVLGELVKMRRNRSETAAQGLVNGSLVFEAKITGMTI